MLSLSNTRVTGDTNTTQPFSKKKSENGKRNYKWRHGHLHSRFLKLTKITQKKKTTHPRVCWKKIHEWPHPLVRNQSCEQNQCPPCHYRTKVIDFPTCESISSLIFSEKNLRFLDQIWWFVPLNPGKQSIWPNYNIPPSYISLKQGGFPY